ncbi:MAG: hypothetical protein C4310_13505 [Chloroflexota bacterium]
MGTRGTMKRLSVLWGGLGSLVLLIVACARPPTANCPHRRRSPYVDRIAWRHFNLSDNVFTAYGFARPR